jgi:Zn-dependent peptidase ImmA (M78 family)
MQRAFAAEFLSPFEKVEAITGGDYSSEAQRDTAEHFDVSPLIIRTLLINCHRLPSEELVDDLDLTVAA